jgi:fatty acid-binding protein DegV
MTSILASMLKFIILISWDERGLVQFNKTRDRNKLCSLIFDGIYTCNADKVKYEPKNVKRVWYGVSKFSSEKFKIDELLQELKAYKKFPNAKEYIDSFPSVIECHTGPNYIIVGVEIK